MTATDVRAACSVNAPMSESSTSPEILTSGDHVQVITRRGRIVVGIWLDGWGLKSGGVAFKVKPPDSSPVYGTTLQPIKLMVTRAAVADQPGHGSRLAG